LAATTESRRFFELGYVIEKPNLSKKSTPIENRAGINEKYLKYFEIS
jgi:hypothetical protein